MNKKASNSKPQIPDTPQTPITDNQKSEVEELTADLKRLQAEFINYRNQMENEKATLSQFSKAQIIKELLPVIDDLERALAHLPDDLKEHKWAQGVQKAYERLQKQLEKLSISKIDALHQPFDPGLHEAVQAEGDGDHQVVSEVLQNGYRYHNQILRHAIVKVKSEQA